MDGTEHTLTLTPRVEGRSVRQRFRFIIGQNLTLLLYICGLGNQLLSLSARIKIHGADSAC
jgi:hypothetical protein